MGCCLKCGKRDLPKSKANGLRYCRTCGFASDGGKFDTAGFPISPETRAHVRFKHAAIGAYVAACRDRDGDVVRRPGLSLIDLVRARIAARGRLISLNPEDRTERTPLWHRLLPLSPWWHGRSSIAALAFPSFGPRIGLSLRFAAAIVIAASLSGASRPISTGAAGGFNGSRPMAPPSAPIPTTPPSNDAAGHHR